MWRLGPDGYGSISSWYQWFSTAGTSGPGFGTLNARASSQTRCHFGSIFSGSYFSIGCSLSPETKKPLVREARELDAAAAAISPCAIEGAASSPAPIVATKRD